MASIALALASISALALGGFWPTLRVNFEHAFARRFLVPAFVVAAADCFVIAQSIGWWTALAYPVLAVSGAALIGVFTSGKHLKAVVFGGGIWIVGLLAAVLAVLAVTLRSL
jgi:hypothetical protein